MKYTAELVQRRNGLRRKKSNRFLLLVFTLAVLCVGGMELAFCRFFAPVLFRQVTDPVVRPVVQAVEAVQAQVELWRFQRQRDALAARISVPAGSYLTPHPVTLPQPARQVKLPEREKPTPVPTPAVTEFIQKDGKTILTGGVPCVYYNQNDAAWKDKLFGSDPIGPYGCGPTAMAIVVSSLTDQSFDPAQMSVWAYDHGYWCAGSGSYLTIVEGTAKAFGLKCTLNKQCDEKTLTDHLNSGGVAVALMGPGHFSELGHFIVLHGVAPNGQLMAADSASRERSLTLWDPELILKEAAREGEGVRMWLISPGEE